MIDAPTARPTLPTGTVTFLRTDVEGSMAFARALGSRWDEINATHLDLLRTATEGQGGIRVKTEGDALFAVFPEAGAAVRAAIDGQRLLAAHPWPEDAQVRVRMGLHSGEAHLAGDDYGGFDVNRVARIAAAGHGGQIVISEATRLLAEASLYGGVTVRDLGRHVLRGVPAPERLFQLDIPGLQVTFPPLRTARPTAGNLPMRLTSFLGREADLAELEALFQGNRLVTLTGPGGIGKTSLAIELGRTWLDRVPDGVWFVGLDSISEPAIVRAEIARSLGLFDGPNRPAANSLEHYLANRSMIFIIDNFEHVLEAAGEVTAILRASVGIRIIVTSRAPLRLPGEQEYPVRPLADNGATRELFIERARAVHPGWDPGADVGVIDEISSMLDGLPLGLELAAARVSLLPLPAIRDRLAARLPLPGSGPRDVPQRQRTLASTISWSHDLLGEADQRLLHDLAVFEGSFDVEQAAAIHGDDVLDSLAGVVDQSLVTRDSDGDPSAIRFRVLQTIRMFALDRLRADGRDVEVRRRHAIAYLGLAEEAASHLPGRNQPRWLDRLTLDHDNLRAAVQWSIDADEADLALRLVGALWRYWHLDGHLVEARTLTDAALALPGAADPTKARLGAVTAAGGIAYWDGRPDEAFRLYEEQRELARVLGDAAAEADAIFNLSYERFVAEDPSGAEALIQDATDRFLALGDERGAARATWARASVHLQSGDPTTAESILTDVLGTFERLDDAWYHAMTVGSLAWTHYARGNVNDGGRWLAQGFAETYALQDVASTVINLPATAIMAVDAGRHEEAAVLIGAAEALGLRYGVQLPLGLGRLIARANAEARAVAVIGEEKAEAARDRGRRLSLDEAAELVARLAAEHYSRQ